MERAGEECSGDRQKDRQTGRQADRRRVWAAGRGPDPHFLPWCFGSVRQAFERSFAGSAGRRANGRSETSF